MANTNTKKLIPNYAYQEKRGGVWVTTYGNTDPATVYEHLANCLMYRYLWKANYAKRITESSNGVTRTITVYDGTNGSRTVFTLKA